MTRTNCFFLMLLSCGLLLADELPTSSNPDVKVSLFAGNDLIKHPIGMTFTQDGKLLAVESHTHLRPKTYNGPESDHIIWLQDTDNDGKADKRSVFYGENLKATMNIAVHPMTGAIYVATKNGVHRLWDKDGDGVADGGQSERLLIFDFESEFLDNGYGCAGLAFENEGNLIFGIGGLLGAPYTLEDQEGTKYADQGEGGNIWKCTDDGKKLVRFATGFWNPFGLCYTPEGHVFATDNDPSSRPPSRLHHVIDGGDYGYQYRYGRSGRHPFIAWDGELPGTLPMLSGIGDAPCDVLHYRGNLLIASWSDHVVEYYPLTWNKTHYTTERKVLLKGGIEFRPVGFAMADSGELYVSDWVKGDYQLHGEGKIWLVKDWHPEPATKAIWSGEKQCNDPWIFSRMVSGHASADTENMPKQAADIYKLLSARFHNKEDGEDLIRAALAKGQEDETLRLLALKWISDQKLIKFRPAVVEQTKNPVSAKIFHAAITAQARLDNLGVMDDDLQKLLLSQLDAKSPLVRQTAFLLLEEREKVPVEKMRKLYENGDDEMRSGVALTLQKHEDKEAAQKFAREIVANSDSQKVRAFANMADPDAEDIRPENSAEFGEFLFHKHCAKCHRVNGYGRRGGPDLSRIGVRGKEHILKSVMDPSAEISPQYETWEVTMGDGAKHVGFVVGEKSGVHFYSDATGAEFTINAYKMLHRERLPVSLMPPMLNEEIGNEDFQHMLNWLASLGSDSK